MRLIFERCIAGKSNKEIAKELNEAGYKTPLEFLHKHNQIKGWHSLTSEGVWTASTVLRIITEERYTGKSIYGRTRVAEIGSKQCVSVPKSEWVVVPDRIPPVISQEIYDQAQAVRKKMSQSYFNEKRLPSVCRKNSVWSLRLCYAVYCYAQ